MKLPSFTLVSSALNQTMLHPQDILGLGPQAVWLPCESHSRRLTRTESSSNPQTTSNSSGCFSIVVKNLNVRKGLQWGNHHGYFCLFGVLDFSLCHHLPANFAILAFSWKHGSDMFWQAKMRGGLFVQHCLYCFTPESPYSNRLRTQWKTASSKWSNRMA